MRLIAVVLLLVLCPCVRCFVREVQLHPSGEIFEAAAAKFGNYFADNKEYRGNAVFADPIRLCEGPYNGNDMQERIVVAERSADCPYEQKTILADFRGALALVLLEVDNSFTDDYMRPYQCFTDETATIPVVLIKSKEDSNTVRGALVADPYLEISVNSSAGWLGETCSSNIECKGYPVSTVCSTNTSTCQCRSPFFNENSTEEGPVCVKDPAQNIDSITGRGSCSELHELNSTGCSEDIFMGLPMTREQCRLFPFVQCISDTCVCAHEYEVNATGQCWPIQYNTTTPITAEQTTTEHVTPTLGTTEGVTTGPENDVSTEANWNTVTLVDSITTQSRGSGSTTSGETNKDIERCLLMYADGFANFKRELPTRDGGTELLVHDDLSVLDCALVCLRCVNCLSFYHNSVNGTCLGHSTKEPVWLPDAENKWQLFSRY